MPTCGFCMGRGGWVGGEKRKEEEEEEEEEISVCVEGEVDGWGDGLDR